MWVHVNYVRARLMGIPISARLVAYAIASRIGADGTYRYSSRQLMDDTGCSRASVVRAMNVLQDIFINRTSVRGMYVLSERVELELRPSPPKNEGKSYEQSY